MAKRLKPKSGAQSSGGCETCGASNVSPLGKVNITRVLRVVSGQQAPKTVFTDPQSGMMAKPVQSITWQEQAAKFPEAQIAPDVEMEEVTAEKKTRKKRK